MMSTVHKKGARVSEYILEECVGTGTFGEVWKARHHVWDNDFVAVKLPTEPEYVRYLQHEGVVVHGIRHPNIVRVQGLDPYAEVPYLVMELVDGPSLRQMIDEHPLGMPMPVVDTVMRGILRAIVAAHEANVLHRDLKPGNVLLNLRGRAIEDLAVDDVKVSDFGLGVNTADTLRSIAQSASLAREDRVVGTLAYMAPEVRDEGRKPDARSDLFAIGVMLFEMLTGQRPAGAELPGTMRAEAGDLDDVFRKLYARYERRYESAAAVLAEFENVVGPATVPPLPVGRHESKSKYPTAEAPPLPTWIAAEPAEETEPVGGYVRRCPKCSTLADGTDQFCTQCGQQLVRMVRRCGSCGAYPAPEDRYCIFCGAVVDTVVE
ncbi:MAG: protein kinase [Phycisphaerae bacterium]|nr:protein kinase [Phycisphaerae bacterium]